MIALSLGQHRGSDAAEAQRRLVDRITRILTEVLSDQEAELYSIASPLQRLLAVHRNLHGANTNDRPDSPLSRSSLFTGTRLDASLASQ
ncbi:MAG: hypothetical protein ACKN9U_26945, partial [Pirellulaceae bacterium]